MIKDADGIIKDILKNSFENEKSDLIYEFQNKLKWRKMQREAKTKCWSKCINNKRKSLF